MNGRCSGVLVSSWLIDSCYDHSQTTKLRITLSGMIIHKLPNQLNNRFIDDTLDVSQKYLLYTAVNSEIISLSLLAQFSLSLWDIYSLPISGVVSSAVLLFFLGEWSTVYQAYYMMVAVYDNYSKALDFVLTIPCLY